MHHRRNRRNQRNIQSHNQQKRRTRNPRQHHRRNRHNRRNKQIQPKTKRPARQIHSRTSRRRRKRHQKRHNRNSDNCKHHIQIPPPKRLPLLSNHNRHRSNRQPQKNRTDLINIHIKQRRQNHRTHQKTTHPAAAKLHQKRQCSLLLRKTPQQQRMHRPNKPLIKPKQKRNRPAGHPRHTIRNRHRSTAENISHMRHKRNHNCTLSNTSTI